MTESLWTQLEKDMKLKALILMCIAAMLFIGGMAYQKGKISQRYNEVYDPGTDSECYVWDYVVNGSTDNF